MLVSGRVCIRNHETLFGLMGAGRGDTDIFHLNIQLGDLQIHKDVHRFPNQTVHLCILEMGHRYFLRRTDILLMVQKSCTSYQLRLVVFPTIYRVLYVPVGAGFLPSTVPLNPLALPNLEAKCSSPVGSSLGITGGWHRSTYTGQMVSDVFFGGL